MELILLLCPILSFFGIALLVILSVIAYAVWSKHAQEASWKILASRIGLAYEPGGFFSQPSLVGEFQNHQVKLDVHSHTTGYKSASSSFPYTRIRFELQNQTNSTLTIREKHRMPLLTKAGVHIGDPAVDSRFSIHSIPPELAIQIFNSTNLRQEILSARSFDLELSGIELRFEERGIDKDSDYLIWLLRLLYEVVIFIENR
jgi:hypothetical protein